LRSGELTETTRDLSSRYVRMAAPEREGEGSAGVVNGDENTTTYYSQQSARSVFGKK
jgi:hypothetical protein